MKRLIYLILALAFLVSCSKDDRQNIPQDTVDAGDISARGFIMDDDTSTLIAVVNGKNVRYAPFRSYMINMLGIDPDTFSSEIVSSVLQTWLSREAVYDVGVQEGYEKDSIYIFMEFDATRQIISQMVLERLTLSMPGVSENEIRSAYDKWKEEIKYEKKVVLYQFFSETMATIARDKILEGVEDTLVPNLVGLDTVEGIRRLYSNMELIEEAVANLKSGEVSEPFSVGDGYFVAKVIEEKYIESPMTPYEQIRPYIMLYLTELNKYDYLNSFVDTLLQNNVTIFDDSIKLRVSN
ncbi:peptidyl-prolyl cis-trans isomerase [candidate division WOR-3 bacterium]|nr:peptidyl-prolyl cis-trans isomerase [candidate division WOR-3 bacterium]